MQLVTHNAGRMILQPKDFHVVGEILSRHSEDPVWKAVKNPKRIPGRKREEGWQDSSDEEKSRTEDQVLRNVRRKTRSTRKKLAANSSSNVGTATAQSNLLSESSSEDDDIQPGCPHLDLGQSLSSPENSGEVKEAE